MPKLRLTQNQFPQKVICDNGVVNESKTSPNLTDLLQRSADYWNEAQRLEYQERNQTVTDPLVEFVTNTTDIRPDDVKVGICSCGSKEAGAYFPASGLICLDEHIGINLYTSTHESGHALGLFHSSPNTPSVMSADQTTRTMYERFKCNPPNPPFLNDVEFTKLTTSHKTTLVEEGPYREVLSEPADVQAFQECRISHPLYLVALGVQRSMPAFVASFLTTIVNEVLALPSLKKLKHYESLKKISKLLPNLLFMVLTIGLNGANLTTFVALGSTVAFTMITQFLRNPCINNYMTARYEDSLKGTCYRVLTDPYAGLFFASLANCVTPQLIDRIPIGQSIPSSITLQTESIMGLLSPLLGLGLGYASNYFVKLGFKSAYKKFMSHNQIAPVVQPDSHLRLVPTSTENTVAIEIEPPNEESLIRSAPPTLKSLSASAIRFPLVETKKQALSNRDYPTIVDVEPATVEHTAINIEDI